DVHRRHPAEGDEGPRGGIGNGSRAPFDVACAVAGANEEGSGNERAGGVIAEAFAGESAVVALDIRGGDDGPGFRLYLLRVVGDKSEPVPVGADREPGDVRQSI